MKIKDPTYEIPKEPTYHAEIRKFQNDDLLHADNVINPVIQQMVENAEYNRKQLEMYKATVTTELKNKPDKKDVYTKSQTDLVRTYTLVHTKSGAVHALTGLPTTNGIFQCQFKATANYAEGDTFEGYTAKPSGEDATLPDKAFVTGDLVSVVVDTESKLLGFKLGGSTYGTLSPQIRNFAAKAGNHQITLSWTNPSDSNHAGTYIVRKQGSAPQKLSDGTKIDVGKATSYTDNEPECDKLYYYRAFPYNAKKQVQTELTGAVVSAMPKAFQLPRYTGQHAIFGNEEKGRIEMYSSGTLTLDKGTYDLFAVGGGGSGSIGYYSRKKGDYYGGSGAGSGYTATKKRENIFKSDISVIIGSGGAGVQGNDATGKSGGNTTIGDILSAEGGLVISSSSKGGAGGSGGGGQAVYGGFVEPGGAGGADGSNGQTDNKNYSGMYGKGQGKTTRAFEESSGMLYAGGGGASGWYGHNNDYSVLNSPGGAGGAGGGGQGSYGSGIQGSGGTPNTGGGGGGVSYKFVSSNPGGSGIAIVRWGY